MVSIISEARIEAKKHGYTICCYEAGHLFRNGKMDVPGDLLYKLVNKQNSSGIVIPVTSLGPFVKEIKTPEFIKEFSDIPTLIIGRKEEGIPCLIEENKSGIRELINHLVKIHNYRKIAFITGPDYNSDAVERFESYEESLTYHSIKIDHSIIFEGDFTSTRATKLGPNILKQYRAGKIEVLVCANDASALGIIKYLKNQNIKVPGDIAVTGFDDCIDASRSRPPLTSINLPTEEIGRLAITQMLSLIKGEENKTFKGVATTLVIRESCGCIPWIESTDLLDISLDKITAEMGNIDTEELDLFFNPLHKILTSFISDRDDQAYRHNLLHLLDNLIKKSGTPDTTIAKLSLFFATICSNIDNLEILKLISVASLNSLNIAKDIYTLSRGNEHVQMIQLQQAIIYYSRDLISIKDEEEFYQECSQILPNVGINDCLIAISNENDFYKSATSVFLLKNGKRVVIDQSKSKNFDPKELLPKEYWESSDDTDKIIYPIVQGPNCRGYIVFANLNIKLDYCEQVYSIINYTYSNFYLIRKIKEQNNRLAKAQEYINNIIDSMPSLLIGVDSNRVITQWNAEAEKRTGISYDKALGLNIEVALPDFSEEIENINFAIKSKKEVKNLKKIRIIDKQKRYEDITIYPLTLKGAEGAVIRIDDITERVRMEEIMVQSEKMMSVGGLAAGMAHEINNPLAGMMQSAEVITNRLTNTTLRANVKVAEELNLSLKTVSEYLKKRNIVEMLGMINESGAKAADIVANMLTFSRKGKEGTSLHKITELIDKCIKLSGIDFDLKHDFDFKQIIIERDYQEYLPEVPCESDKIQQVIMNILKNGAEAMYNNSRKSTFKISVRFDKETNFLTVEIEDNGSGMTEDIRKRIFEPFFTTKEPDKGTGLGLSVSYFIIKENHSGKIEVESVVDKGSKFIISLPT